MEIISRREVVNAIAYFRSFSWRNDPGSGFSFPCDKDGNIDPLTNDAAIENFEGCVSGKFDVIDNGIEKSEWTYVNPTIGRCDCGEEIPLDGFTNTCDCGRDYNSAGQLLAPRSQWGEETGEYLSDILRIP